SHKNDFALTNRDRLRHVMSGVRGVDFCVGQNVVRGFARGGGFFRPAIVRLCGLLCAVTRRNSIWTEEYKSKHPDRSKNTHEMLFCSDHSSPFGVPAPDGS